MFKYKEYRIFLVVPCIAIIVVLGWLLGGQLIKPSYHFDGEKAYQDVVYQVSLGPRTVGSQAHDQVVPWINRELEKTSWQVDNQLTTVAGNPIKNIIGRRGSGTPWIIVGAHYDSRLFADRDPDPSKRQQPVPGANDGASGVAVLLELARSLPPDLQGRVWLVFFDAEDNGDFPGWDWIEGSRAFASQMDGYPDAVIVIDMIGDAHLNIYQERSSDPNLTDQVWAQAAQLGYTDHFISQKKYNILDDHTPFLQKGIPAIDIIDFDYPYWHTTQDTPDKVSAESLGVVGETLWQWLVSVKQLAK